MSLTLWLILTSSFQTYSSTSALPPEVLNLARIKQKVKSGVERIPDYTCLQTIERWSRTSEAKAIEYSDTLRLEVGVVNGKEVFSWPGRERFEDQDAAAIVEGGLTSAGEFAQFLRSVFVAGAARIVWYGEEEVRGRRALRYDFTLPLYAFQWHVNVEGFAGKVAARGSFWADAGTLDVLRMEAHATDIPIGMPLAKAVSVVEYGPVAIRGAGVWLPQSAEVVMVDATGKESRNAVEFSHCRQYGGTATISFSDPSAESASPRVPAEVQRVELAGGLELVMRLGAEIDSRTAAVGDPITARMDSDVMSRSRVVIPKGALVRGRIRRFEKSSDVARHFVVGLEFSEIEFADRRARFFGKLVTIQEIPGLRWFVSAPRDGVKQYPQFRVYTSHTESIRAQDLPGVGTFFMTTPEFRLPLGLRMVWRTTAAPARGLVAR